MASAMTLYCFSRLLNFITLRWQQGVKHERKTNGFYYLEEESIVPEVMVTTQMLKTIT